MMKMQAGLGDPKPTGDHESGPKLAMMVMD